ncbi:hypothetical protein [Tamaricihabitans halophyticus]|uniref:hypothetical protein n=1 Tax=Tamaricihabitans halophyticus TaxID=1262583 RepID=UPI00104A0829|nr:hypothetical protein [Tamaricihabitans halophyticus]
MPEHVGSSLARTLDYARGLPDGTALGELARAAFSSAQSTTMLIAAACSAIGALVAATVIPRNRAHAA